jgi:hypothetical protein
MKRARRFLKCCVVAIGIGIVALTGRPPVGFSEGLVNRVILIDDFEKGVRTNLLGGKTQGDEEFPGGCLASFAGDEGFVFGSRGYSLKLDYDVAIPGSFSYYWSTLGPPVQGQNVSEPLNLQDYQYLSFWVRSDRKMPQFVVEIHEDTDGDRLFTLGKDVVSRALVLAYVPVRDLTQWQKVVIPFSRFRQIEKWSRILEIAFIFENQLGSEKGTVYIDDILFGSNFPDGKTSPTDQVAELESFRLNGTEASGASVTLQEENQVSFKVRSVSPYLERAHLDVSWDEGKNWQTIKNFYDHGNQEQYDFTWSIPEKKGANVQLRLGVTSVLGQETVLFPRSESQTGS